MMLCRSHDYSKSPRDNLKSHKEVEEVLVGDVNGPGLVS